MDNVIVVGSLFKVSIHEKLLLFEQQNKITNLIYYFIFIYVGIADLPVFNQSWQTDCITLICFQYPHETGQAKRPCFTARMVNKHFFTNRATFFPLTKER